MMKFFDLLGIIKRRNDTIEELKKQKHEMMIKFQEARNLAEQWQENHRQVCSGRMRLELRYRMLLELAMEMSGEHQEELIRRVDRRIKLSAINDDNLYT